jgi:hypothetical protein
MHPNLRLFLSGRVRQESQGVAVIDVAQMALPPPEHGPVYGRPEAARAAVREGGWGVGHRGHGICRATRRYTGGYAGQHNSERRLDHCRRRSPS